MVRCRDRVARSVRARWPSAKKCAWRRNACWVSSVVVSARGHKKDPGQHGCIRVCGSQGVSSRKTQRHIMGVGACPSSPRLFAKKVSQLHHPRLVTRSRRKAGVHKPGQIDLDHRSRTSSHAGVCSESRVSPIARQGFGLTWKAPTPHVLICS